MKREDDVELLREHLLGARHAGPGLIRRVEQRVQEITYEPGPGYKTGSMIGVVDQHHDSEEDEGKVFDLLVVLIEWQRQEGMSLSRTEYSERLARWKVTDRDLLLGGPRLVKVLGTKARPHLERTRLLGQKLLKADPPPEANVERCRWLATYLVWWLDSACLHDFEKMPGDVGTLPVFVCAACDARRSEDSDGRWLAV